MLQTDVLKANLQAVQAEIDGACARARRAPGEVALLPVTKYVGTDAVRALLELGRSDFGESTVQEMLRKQGELPGELNARWHLIGRLQRNKVGKAIAAAASIHSLDGVSLAREIDKKKATNPHAALKFFVEINIAAETAKTGLPPAELETFLKWLRAETSLWPDLAGLMAMAPKSKDPEAARPFFRRLRELRDRAGDQGLLPAGAGLSMGMSADFAAAVEEGATVLRIGSRLFEGLPRIQ